MLERIQKVKERIENLNNGFRSLNNFGAAKDGQFFSGVMKAASQTASKPEAINNGKKVMSKSAENSLKKDIFELIEKYSESENIDKKSIENFIVQIFKDTSKTNELSNPAPILKQNLNGMLNSQGLGVSPSGNDLNSLLLSNALSSYKSNK